MPRTTGVKSANNGKQLATQQSVDQAVWSICDIMWRGNVAGAEAALAEINALSAPLLRRAFNGES